MLALQAKPAAPTAELDPAYQITRRFDRQMRFALHHPGVPIATFTAGLQIKLLLLRQWRKTVSAAHVYPQRSNGEFQCGC
jgi:hypothetical protein